MNSIMYLPKSIITLFFIVFLYVSCVAQENDKKENEIIEKNIKVTFVELGSVNCVPCKLMQPVMSAIEKKYGDQIKVIFYDVWQADQKKYAKEYGINLIPTQVFLDENGKEFHRHQGFYPEAEIDKVLQSKGLKPKEEI